MKAKRRLELGKAYGHLYYKPEKIDLTKCIYCGAGSQCVDHCPPISMLETVSIDKFVDDGIQFYLYPSCMDCNKHLSNKKLVILFDRLNYLFDVYTKKVELQERWTTHELSEMSGRLKQYIQNQQYKVNYYNRKLGFIDQQMRNLLNDENVE